MAIAPLPFIGGPDVEDVPWPRPTLTLVKEPVRVNPRDEIQEFRPRLGLDIEQRRSLRASRRVIRRRIIAAIVAVMAVVALILPLSALGTVTISGQATPGGTPAGLADGSVYVVHPGDTLQGIANQINPAQAQNLAQKMAQEVGSNTVVPGEHIVLP